MATTDNYKLAQLELTNSANFPVLLNNTFKTIDKGLTLDVGTSTGTENDYVLNLGSITLSSANKGISFKFWADKDSNGAVTINGTYHLVKASGNPVKNLKRNAPYTITYDGGTNFFLASGGVDDVNFSASDLLSGKTANNSDGEKVTGTMPNIGQQTATINAGGKVTISKGYHDGTGHVQSNSMSTQLSNLGVTLTSASQLVKDVKAVNKNGSLITGTATIASLGGLELRTGTISINNTNLRDNTYTLQLSQLNLPRTPKFVICDWRLTYARKINGSLREFTASSYTFFDFINDKCYYPTNTEWNHSESGNYEIVDTIREFRDKTILYMHIKENGRYLIPTITGYENSNFSRDPMRVFWTAFV